MKSIRITFVFVVLNMIFSSCAIREEVSSTSTPILELKPTFENCGVYLRNVDSSMGNDINAELFFRRKGERDWRSALPMVHVSVENAWRGSLFFLKENERYDMKIILTGNGKRKKVTGEFKTLNSRVPIKKTITLKADEFKSPCFIKESGSPEGYVKYVATPGCVLRGVPNSLGVIVAANARYIIFEGLTIRANQAKHGIFLRDCDHIQIKNCDISGFGQVGERGNLNQWGQYGQYYMPDGNMVNHNAGIFINKSGDVLVERCYVHDPAANANSWFHAHPAGAEAMLVLSTGGVVVRYNDFIGSDAHRWNDAIEGIGNGSVNGGFHRDADIYGNLLAFSNDDAIEIEGGEMNIRVYFNRFEGFYCGVSTGSCRLGPSYQFRNLFVNPGDVLGKCGVPNKNGHKNSGDGTVFILNNTIAPSAKYGKWLGHFGEPLPSKPLKAYTRNNLVLVDRAFTDVSNFKHRLDLDYDGFWSGNPDVLERVKTNLERQKQETHAIFAKPEFVSVDTGDYRLAPHSAGRNAGVPLSNLLSENEKPNLGAFQDDDIESLPFRPVPFNTDKMELRLTPGKTTETFTVKVKGDDFRSQFKTRKNRDFDWFDVSPGEGVLESGKELEFTVSLDPDKMPKANLYRGMLLVRLPNGYSRPVSVYADFRACPIRLARERKRIVFLKPKFISDQEGEVEFKIETPGWYSLFAKARVPFRQNIAVSIGDEKVEKAKLFKNDRLEWTSVCRYGGTPNSLWFHLSPGTRVFKFRAANKVAIKEFALVPNPNLILK